MLSLLYWLRAPALRTRRGALSLTAMLVFVVVFTGGGNRSALWFAGGFFAIAGLSLLPIGRLPVEMPVRGEPGYRLLARRGRLAAVVLIVGEVAWGVVLAVGYH